VRLAGGIETVEIKLISFKELNSFQSLKMLYTSLLVKTVPRKGRIEVEKSAAASYEDGTTCTRIEEKCV